MKIKDSNAREYMNHINTLAQIAGVSEYEGMLIYRKLRRDSRRDNSPNLQHRLMPLQQNRQRQIWRNNSNQCGEAMAMFLHRI